jgi:HAD superfamily, subfamily IIIB (Acid phosphatase)
MREGLRRQRLLRAALILLAGTLLFAAGFALAAELTTKNVRTTSESAGTPIKGLRPTGVGLPLVGAHGTVGLGDYSEEVKEYHDSGQYGDDLAAVDQRARAYLKRQAARLRAQARRRCQRDSAREVGVSERRGASCPKPQLALVLDVDETALSHYQELSASNFHEVVAALAVAVATADSPAIQPTLTLYRRAQQLGVSVFFITGRPGSIPQVRERTEENLRAAGYENWEGLILNDTEKSTIPYKTDARAEIEKQGYRIIANVGDQESDLAGGYADRSFKLPNPFYFIG